MTPIMTAVILIYLILVYIIKKTYLNQIELKYVI